MNIYELCEPSQPASLVPERSPDNNNVFPRVSLSPLSIPVKEEEDLDLKKLIVKCSTLCHDLSLYKSWGSEKEAMLDMVSLTAKDILDTLVSMHRKPKYKRRSKRSMVGQQCHYCHTSVTPEWRRGPGGARTLCNACGLHYSKLLRRESITVSSITSKLLHLDPP